MHLDALGQSAPNPHLQGLATIPFRSSSLPFLGLAPPTEPRPLGNTISSLSEHINPKTDPDKPKRAKYTNHVTCPITKLAAALFSNHVSDRATVSPESL